MRKTDSYKKINRNNTSMYDNTNGVTPNSLMSPDMFVDHMWLHEDDVTTGVQIIELNSSDSGKSVNDDKDFDINNDWRTYVRQSSNDTFQANMEAHERRCMQSQENTNDEAYEFSIDENEYDDGFIYSDLFESGSNNMQKENAIYNHQVNCFTILDKHLVDSDTSGEDYADVQLCGYSDPEWGCNAGPYDSEIVAYTPETDTEKRTVWIYSFKNKRLLSDNDFELVNIPSQETSTITSIEDIQTDNELKEHANRKTPTPLPRTHRVATPIPLTHVPRLNLAVNPTLPTVTEVTETDKQSTSNQTDIKIFEANRNLKANNWFSSEHATPNSEKINRADKSSNIVNWMALSPREKRRRFRNTSPIPLSPNTNLLPTLKEVSLNEEALEEELVDCEDSIKESPLAEKIPHSSSNQSPKSVMEQIGSAIVDSARRSFRTVKSGMSSPRDVTLNQSNVEMTESSMETTVPKDRGDHKKKRAPRIKVSPKLIATIISEPIEKLDSDNWIKEEKLIKDTVERPTNARGDCASDVLWINNMSLLKPAQWTEYLPITESVPSLHFSVNTDSDNHVPWYRRLLRCFRCCK